MPDCAVYVACMVQAVITHPALCTADSEVDRYLYDQTHLKSTCVGLQSRSAIQVLINLGICSAQGWLYGYSEGFCT